MDDHLTTNPERPDPERIHTRADFGRELTLLRRQAGLSIRDISKSLEKLVGKRKAPPSTIGAWFVGGLPSTSNLELFKKLLGQCGIVDEAITKQWVNAWLRAGRTAAHTQAGEEPYRGLESFGTGDAAWFFGRRTLTEELLAEIDSAHNAGGGVLIVVGASGSGKSSLLQAGVIPALSAGAISGSEHWTTLRLTPGSHPVDELAKCLGAPTGIDALQIAKKLYNDPTECSIYSRLAASTGHSGDVENLNIAGDSVPDRRLVLIVDQFEQVFTAIPDKDEKERHLFIAALCAAATGPDAALVIIGLRADFYAHALRHPQLVAALRERQITVGAMNDDELREVITQPALKAKMTVEDGLVELLLRDVCPRNGLVAHGAGVLPLLSHALYATWAQSNGHRLTTDDYREVGGVDGAVAASAEKIFADLPPTQQELARHLFLRLVHVHADTADTRRRVPLGELFGGANADELGDVLDRFVAQRLVTIDTETVEITHEALMTAWPTLREWLDTDRSGRIMAQQLDAAARSWDQENRGQEDLYRGPKLYAAQAWADGHRDELEGLTREFLDASAGYARRQQRRRAVRRYQLVAVLVVIAMLGAFTSLTIGRKNVIIERERDEALSRMLATRANVLRDTDVSVARQLSLAAYRIAPTVEARSSLIDASALRPAVWMRAGDEVGIMPAAVFHPDGTTLAAAADNSVRLWNIAEAGHPRPLTQLPAASEAKIYALAFRPDGQLLAEARGDATIRLWNTANLSEPVQLTPLSGVEKKVYSVAFSPDGQLLAAASSDGHVRLWEINGEGQATALGTPVPIDGSAAKSVSFHLSNRFLAVGSENGTVQLWDITDPTSPVVAATPTGPTKAIGQVTFSPDGRMLAAGSADSSAYLWNVTDPRRPEAAAPPLTGATSWINAVAFSPDSTFLAVASSDADLGVRVFDLATMRVTATLPHPAPATAVKFSPDGKAIVTGANDGSARLWPLFAPTMAMPYTVSGTRFSPQGNVLAIGSGDTQLWDVTDPRRPTPYGSGLINSDGFSSHVAFTTDGRTLAAAHGGSGGLQIWDITDPASPAPLGELLRAHDRQQIESLEFSPDDRVLATGSRDKTVRLWDIGDPTKPEPLTTLTGFDGYVHWVAFSPDARLLAAASADKTVRLWDVTDPVHPAPIGQPFTPANHYVYSAVFSPDGQLLAVSSGDSTIRLFDVTDPAQPRPVGEPLTGPTNYVYSVSFNTEGTTLAAAVTDGTVWLWDLHQRDKATPIATLTVPTDTVYTVDFQPDHDVLVAGGSSRTAWLWHTDPEQAAAHVCATTGDPITEAEWARYVPGRSYQPPCHT